MGDKEVVDGAVYLERIASKVGTGDTAKNAMMENFWRAKVMEDGSTRMELLDDRDQPTGYWEPLDPDELGVRFIHQDGWQERQANPKKERADKITARAERHLEQQEFNSAEFEFSKALKLDDKNLKANYGLGRTFMAQGEPDKAKEVFGQVAQLDEVLDPRHKHIFNDCAMHLRQLGQFSEAVNFYQRALRLEMNDENLWFNLGRALMEWGQGGKACQAFQRALSLNPDMVEARELLAHCQA